MDLHGSTGIGCTDTVTPSDPHAFVGHYEEANAKFDLLLCRTTVPIDGQALPS